MITLVGAAIAEANSVTIPAGHQPGDLMIIYAFRDGSTTNPSLPAGWISSATPDGTTCSARVGCRVATSNAETSGTWTNATAVLCVVLRGVFLINPAIPIDVTPGDEMALSSGSSTTLSFGAVSQPGESGQMAIVAFAAHRSVDTTGMATPPAGLQNVAVNLGASCDVAIHFSVVPVRSWAALTVPVGGTSSGWQTAVIALFPRVLRLNNYHALSGGGNGMSFSERIR